MKFGDLLRQLMEEQNLNQKQLAERLNISAPALGNYIRNLREPDFETLKTCAAFFGVSTDYLLDFQQTDSCSPLDARLLHLFHEMSQEQQAIFLEQGLAVVKYNRKKGSLTAHPPG